MRFEKKPPPAAPAQEWIPSRSELALALLLLRQGPRVSPLADVLEARGLVREDVGPWRPWILGLGGFMRFHAGAFGAVALHQRELLLAWANELGEIEKEIEAGATVPRAPALDIYLVNRMGSGEDADYKAAIEAYSSTRTACVEGIT